MDGGVRDYAQLEILGEALKQAAVWLFQQQQEEAKLK